MAISDNNYIKVDKTSGSGDGNFTFTVKKVNTGRNDKTHNISVSTSDGSITRTFSVLQSGTAEYVNVDSAVFYAQKAADGKYYATITGTSNTSKLSFKLTGMSTSGTQVNGAANQTGVASAITCGFYDGRNMLANTYNSENAGQAYIVEFKVGTSAATMGSAISGDPGANEAYTWSLKVAFTVTENTGEKMIGILVTATTNSGSSKVGYAAIAAGTKKLEIYKEAEFTNNLNGSSVTITNTLNSTVTVYVDSNTSWTVS